MEGIYFRRRSIYNFNARKRRKKKQYIELENTKLRQKFALSGLGNSSYYIASTDLKEFSPDARKQAAKIDFFLSKFIKTVVESTQSDPDAIVEKSITIDDFPCKKFESDFKLQQTKDKRIKGVFCLAENRLYTVFILGEPQLVEENGERFLNSFKIDI